MDQQKIVTARFTVVGLGELLWDLFPSGKRLGGAPTNFAYVSRLLGDDSHVASRVGADALGAEALARLAELGLPGRHIQRDAARPTGTVRVELDERGEPTYESSSDVAWDYLEWTEEWKELAARADAVCFGTLAQRSAVSRATVRSFLRVTPPRAMRVFDVNLRHSLSDAEMLSDSLALARAVKLNGDELPRVAAFLKLGGRGPRELAAGLAREYDLELVAVTRGGDGSLLLAGGEVAEHPGCRVQVADTVGAGDAFTAALIHAYLRGASLTEMSEAANRAGAWAASQAGATPPAEPEALRRALAAFEVK